MISRVCISLGDIGIHDVECRRAFVGEIHDAEHVDDDDEGDGGRCDATGDSHVGSIRSDGCGWIGGGDVVDV